MKCYPTVFAQASLDIEGEVDHAFANWEGRASKIIELAEAAESTIVCQLVKEQLRMMLSFMPPNSKYANGSEYTTEIRTPHARINFIVQTPQNN
jgi:hypothetical protein